MNARLIFLWYFTLVLGINISFECVPGPNRSDPEEAEGEEGNDVSCEEIPERCNLIKKYLRFSLHTER